MKSRRIPAYTHHKPTGQARVRINGKSFYLGKYGSPESHDRYDALIAESVIDSEPARSKTLMELSRKTRKRIGVWARHERLAGVGPED